MVYRGRPSKGCSKCRKKKIKCDEKLPGCTQCTRAGTACPGYRDQLDLMFLDESASVVEKINRQQEPHTKSQSPEPTTLKHSTSRSSSTRRSLTESSRGSNTNTNAGTSLNNTNTSLVKSVGAGSIDPFDSFAVPLRPEMQPLLHSFVSGQDPLVPLGPFTPLKDVWLPMVMSDELVFNAMLFHASSNLVGQHESSSSLQVIKYQQQTIRLLNERLGDPNRAVSTETIAVVLGLMVRAIVSVDYATARMHMSGLGRMISHGGGLEGIGLNPTVQEALFWADICYAVLEIIHELSIQILCHENAALNGTLASDCSSYNDALDMVEERIGSFADMTSEDNLRPPYDYRVLQSCRIAATIFIKMVLRNESAGSPSMYSLVEEQLRPMLEETDLANCWGQLGSLLLWILFMGCIAARGTLAYMSFTKYFIYTCEYLKLETREDVRASLARFLWAESVCGLLFDILWEDARSNWLQQNGSNLSLMTMSPPSSSSIQSSKVAELQWII